MAVTPVSSPPPSPLPLVELGLWRWAFDCLFILATLSLLFSFWFVLMTFFLFCQFELGLRQWTPIVCMFLLSSLIYLLQVRLVMIGNHCLFVLTTLYLLLGWVGLVTAGEHSVVVHCYDPLSSMFCENVQPYVLPVQAVLWFAMYMCPILVLSIHPTYCECLH